MTTKFVDIYLEHTDDEGKTIYSQGTCSERAAKIWEKKGWKVGTPPTDETPADPELALTEPILPDFPTGEPAELTAPAADPPVVEGDEVPPTDPAAGNAGDPSSTAGDDADSNASKPARGGRSRS